MVLHNYYVEVHKDHKEKTKKKKGKLYCQYISLSSLYFMMCLIMDACIHIYREKGKWKNLSLVRQNLLVYCFQIFAPLVQMVSHPREQ